MYSMETNWIDLFLDPDIQNWRPQLVKKRLFQVQSSLEFLLWAKSSAYVVQFLIPSFLIFRAAKPC